MADKQWPTWLVSYNLDGAQWSMEIVAKDADDARRRLAQASNWGTVDGELVATVPSWRGGFLVPIEVWIRNCFARKRKPK